MTPEKAREIQASSIWEEVVKELDERIKGLEQRFRHIDTKHMSGIEEIREVQCQIRTLETVKRLPWDVEDREQG